MEEGNAGTALRGNREVVSLRRSNAPGSHRLRFQYVIEHAQTESLLRFEQPVEITASLARKPEKKLSLMTAVGDVPNVMRQEVAVGPWHLFSLKAQF